MQEHGATWPKPPAASGTPASWLVSREAIGSTSIRDCGAAMSATVFAPVTDPPQVLMACLRMPLRDQLPEQQ